jgi:hypothetical protein
MIEGTSDSDDKLRLLKEDLQRARAEQEAQRALRKAEIGADEQARDDVARGRRDDLTGQLRAIRQLLGEQRESQTERVEQMERRHAEEVRRHETTLRHMSDIQAAVTSLRDEGRAHSEQIAEERARAKAGGYPRFPFQVDFFQTMRFLNSRRRVCQASV